MTKEKIIERIVYLNRNLGSVRCGVCISYDKDNNPFIMLAGYPSKEIEKFKDIINNYIADIENKDQESIKKEIIFLEKELKKLI